MQKIDWKALGAALGSRAGAQLRAVARHGASLPALLRRKESGVPIALALLALLLAGAWLVRHLARETVSGEPVFVMHVAQGSETVDFFFDQVVMEPALLGRTLSEAPAAVSPEIGGKWYWTEPSVLRFAAAQKFPPATRYEFRLFPDRFLPPGKALHGRARLTVTSDRFRVVALTADEEALADRANQVALQGEIRFSHQVSPQDLAQHMRLLDPLRGARDPVALTFLTAASDRVIAFRTEPLTKVADARDVWFEVSRDLQPAAGNVPLASRWRHAVIVGSSVKLVLREVEAVSDSEESRVHLRFSSPVGPALARAFLEVQPAMDYRLSAAGNTLTLAGGFQPGTEFELVVAEGLTALDGALLRESQTQRVRLADLPPFIDFREDGEFLAASGNRTVVVESRNLAKAQLRIDRIYRNNIFDLLRFNLSRSWSRISLEALGDRIVDEELDLGGAANEMVSTAIDLDRYIQEEEPGMYRVTLAHGARAPDPSRWLMLTDLGVVAKRSGDEFLVWVSSFSDLRPVRSARVRLLSHERQVLASG